MVRLRVAAQWACPAALLAALAGGAWWWAVTGAHTATLPPAEPPPAQPPAPAGPDLFRDMTASSGIDFTCRNGEEARNFAILESLGGGVALIDYDGDGLLDIFVVGGGYFDGPDKHQIKGYPNRLYKNLGGWKFQDVTKEVGLDRPVWYGHGVAVADYDRDGWPDLLVTGWGRVALYHNEPDGKGGRRFVDVTAQAGLDKDHSWSTSAAWADLDGDGYPDLYVCHYVNWSFQNDPHCDWPSDGISRDICAPAKFEALPHQLWRNNGNGTFTDVSKDAGLHTERKPEDYARLKHLSPAARERLRDADQRHDFGKGLGVVVVDVNGDGKPDLYVANDGTDKFLYMNRSAPGHIRLEDVGTHAGVARDENGQFAGSMGADAADCDGSGRPSLWVTNFDNELHALYRNLSSGPDACFECASTAAGMAALVRAYVGWGTAFLDFDHDGWEDLVVSNGYTSLQPIRSPVRQRPLLLHHDGPPGRTRCPHFTNVADRGGSYFRAAHRGRGLAVGDLDNDGWPDLVISHVNEPVALLRNDAAGRPAPPRHWLGIELVGHRHRDIAGARVTVEAGGRTLTRFAKGGGSYLSSGDRRLLFGLGAADRVGRVTVTWPAGLVQQADGLAPDRYWSLVEGDIAAGR